MWWKCDSMFPYSGGISGAGNEEEASPVSPLVFRSNFLRRSWAQGCQMAKFDPFLSLDCARVEGVGAQSKERKGSNFAA